MAQTGTGQASTIPRTKWVGYDQDLEWYNADGFKGVPDILKADHDAYPNRPDPPKELN